MKDEDQLNVLGMIHYLIAGFIGLFAFLPVIYLIFGIAILNGAVPGGNQGEMPPKFVGWILIAFSFVIFFLIFTYAGCTALAGWCLQKRKWQTFCIVMAGFSCLHMPFGTAFGILTIYTLTRPSVTKLFENQAEHAAIGKSTA